MIEPGFSSHAEYALISWSGPDPILRPLTREYTGYGSRPLEAYANGVPVRPWAAPTEPSVDAIQVSGDGYEDWLASNVYTSGCGGSKLSDLP